MISFRTSIISKLICLLFAAHIFNISVDAPDADPDWVDEDLSVNDMESISEIICEQILHIENAFPEHEEHDTKTKGSPVFFHFHFKATQIPAFASAVAFNYVQPLYEKETRNFFKQFSPEVLTPPPKA